jgi:hypothetical protein
VPRLQLRASRINLPRDLHSLAEQLDLSKRILAKVYNILDAERIQTRGKPRAPGCAWPAQLQELSDIATGNYADCERLAIYSPSEMKQAWEACEVYGSLPFTSLEKRLTLRYCRTKVSWKKLSSEFGIHPWSASRRICDKVLIEFIAKLTAKTPEEYAKLREVPKFLAEDTTKLTKDCTEDPWGFLPTR